MEIICDQIDLSTLKFSAVKRGQSSPRKWLFITATFNAILVCFLSGGGAEVRFGVEYQPGRKMEGWAMKRACPSKKV